MTAEKEKPNDDDFETIRINGSWRRHVGDKCKILVTASTNIGKISPTLGRQQHAVTQKANPRGTIFW